MARHKIKNPVSQQTPSSSSSSSSSTATMTNNLDDTIVGIPTVQFLNHKTNHGDVNETSAANNLSSNDVINVSSSQLSKSNDLVVNDENIINEDSNNKFSHNNSHISSISNNLHQETSTLASPTTSCNKSSSPLSLLSTTLFSSTSSSSWRISKQISLIFLSSTTILSRAKQYLSSLRPGTFFTSLIPVLMGTILASKTSGGQFSWIILLATLLTVLSVHAAGNLVNTYCDFVRGIDSKRQSDDRTLVDSILTPEEVVNLGVLFYFIGCIGFLVVAIQSPARMELLAFIYFGGLSSSFLYTGGIGLKYIALGDIIIMITFGPVSVLYSFIAQTGTIRLVTLLYAIPLALNTEAILHSNNTRDIDVDRRAGCVTIAMLIGYRLSHVLFALLLFIPYILFVVGALNYSLWFLLPLITLPKAFELERRFRYKQLKSIPRQMARLNFYFGMFYLFACFMSPAHKLPGLLPRL
ncbi:ubiA prenyltransferase domain-containing heix [Dermatophagoides pteronyssinus]|uniref:UbiA prenyltransferase domain-containing protein 1 homolog n=1 Tax=Dermatophagoides pteronyssinus TaxID=6956 RepID=A0A6P6YDH9_DERPT|nr:ubiA prenyltransferase domain-containing protein 1 homolog [Dermatophagoides pteronyssinus]